MAKAGELITEILHRVRDPSGAATSRDQVRDLLDRVQVLLVRQTGTLIRDTPVATMEDQLLYELDNKFHLRIVDIYNVDTDKRLVPVRWSQLLHEGGPQWWRTTDDNGPTVWAPVGTNFYIIYPAAPAVGFNLTLRTQQRPTALDGDEVDIDLPSEYHPMLKDIVEMLILLRNREAALEEKLGVLEMGANGKG